MWGSDGQQRWSKGSGAGVSFCEQEWELLVNSPFFVKRSQRGFNLLELMITITVAAILLAIALPSFRNVIHRGRVTSASNELLATLSYARTEAITRGQLVSLCPSSDSASCAGGTAYEAGWIVYTYPAGAASVGKDYDAASSILLRATAARTGVSVQSGDSAVVTFGQQGQLRPSAPRVFATCYRDGETGTGESSTEVPGTELRVNASGSVISKVLTSAVGCEPS